MLLLAQFALFYRYWLTQIGAFLVYQDKISPADAILVLGGGRKERIVQGVDLYLKKYGNKVIFTGEYQQYLYAHSYHWAIQAQKYAETIGLPKDRVILVLNSSTTHTDATLTKEICVENKFRTLIVVSEPFHTKRAYYTFKKVYAGSGIKVMVYPVQESWYKKDNWWKSKDGLMETQTEYLKWIYNIWKRNIF